jgi:hypothetical protein
MSMSIFMKESFQANINAMLKWKQKYHMDGRVQKSKTNIVEQRQDWYPFHY